MTAMALAKPSGMSFGGLRRDVSNCWLSSGKKSLASAFDQFLLTHFSLPPGSGGVPGPDQPGGGSPPDDPGLPSARDHPVIPLGLPLRSGIDPPDDGGDGGDSGGDSDDDGDETPGTDQELHRKNHRKPPDDPGSSGDDGGRGRRGRRQTPLTINKRAKPLPKLDLPPRIHLQKASKVKQI